MVLEEAEEAELQRLMTAGVDCGESQVQRAKGGLVEVLHLIVKQTQADLFVLVARRQVVLAQILLARRREIARYSIATDFPSAAMHHFARLASDIWGFEKCCCWVHDSELSL